MQRLQLDRRVLATTKTFGTSPTSVMGLTTAPAIRITLAIATSGVRFAIRS